MNSGTFVTPWKAEIEAFYRDETIDKNTLTACLIEDEYRIGKLPRVGNAIDLGAYIGGASLALLSRGFNVISVEMLPENQAMVAKNLKENQFPVRLYRAAVAPVSGQELTACYESRPESTYNGSLLYREENGQQLVVNTISLPQIFDDNDIAYCEFLKVDIEGAEWEIFEALPEKYLDQIDRIAIEIHGLENKKTSTKEFLALLKDKFEDVSSEYFPDWCADGPLVHGYYIRKKEA